MENISLIGIGKLGVCFALNLERMGYNVLGVDINQDYVNSINHKTLKSFEPDVEDMLAVCKNFIATTSLKDAIEFSDDIFVLVATPSLPNGRYDHSQIDGIVEQLETFGKQINRKYLTICCTTMPGYCDTVQGRLYNYNYVVSYNPEFIAQGSILGDQKYADIVLVGEGDKNAGDRIQRIYRKMMDLQDSYPSERIFKRMTRKAAELTKISLNCFLTTKIAYANMIGDIAIDAGVGEEIDKILEAIGSDRRIGKKYLNYGYGYGGPCFPRDNRALGIFATDIGAYSSISEASDTCNYWHLMHQVEMMKRENNPKMPIIFNSVTYKPGTVILEESQQLKLALEMVANGFKVIIQEQPEVIRQLKELYGNKFTYEVRS